VQYQKFDGRYIVRLDSGEPVIETLTDFLKAEVIQFADVSAAGAVESACLGYFDPVTPAYVFRDFQEQLEVVSFQGVATLKDGEPFLHLHGVFGRRDFSTVGGHIKEARVRPTLEVWLRTETIAVRRTPSPASGLDIWIYRISYPGSVPRHPESGIDNTRPLPLAWLSHCRAFGSLVWNLTSGFRSVHPILMARSLLHEAA